MITAARLAGKLAAHAVWCVSDGATLTPMYGCAREGQAMQMTRLAFGDLAAAVAEGRRMLESASGDPDDAVFVFDARLTLGERKVDALVLELRAYFAPDARATLAVPYTPPSSGRFLVHKPKLLEWQGCDDFDIDATFDAFWQGVDSHEQGAKIWNAAIDQSF